MILALDIGGTAVKLGLADREGTLYQKTSADVAFDGYRTPVFTTVLSAARRFLDSVNASRSVPFERVLFALGIRFVGETTARDIARHFGTIEALAAATKEELLAVPEVGEVIADSVFRFFRTPANMEEIGRLKAAGLQLGTEIRSAAASSGPLAGKSIVISGNFSVSRDEMKALIEAAGGRNSSAVSGKTDYLLAGSKPGPEKIKKATELGVAIIDEAQFRAITASGAGLPEAFARIGSRSDASGSPDSRAMVRNNDIDEIEPTLF